MTKYPPVSYYEVALLLAQGVGPEEMQCFDPEYIKSLKCLAGVGLQAPEPIHLDWSDSQ